MYGRRKRAAEGKADTSQPSQKQKLGTTFLRKGYEARPERTAATNFRAVSVI